MADVIGELPMTSGICSTLNTQATENGLNNFRDENVTCVCVTLGVANRVVGTIMDMLKPTYDGPVVTPKKKSHNRSNWHAFEGYCSSEYLWFDPGSDHIPHLEMHSFYVDFERASL